MRRNLTDKSQIADGEVIVIREGKYGATDEMFELSTVSNRNIIYRFRSVSCCTIALQSSIWF